MAENITHLQSPLDEVIARAVEGDHAAFRELYREFVDVVYAVVYQALGENPDVEDLVQKIFIKLFREFPEYRGEKPFRAWLKMTCQFVLYDHLRNRGGTHNDKSDGYLSEEANSFESDSDSPERCFVKSETWRLAYAVLDKLKPDKRMALVMHDFEGYTMEEVAEVMGCSKYTVRSRLVRARREFAEKVKKNKALMQLIIRSVA
jgi:RNA polymerase sigma-70 factor (ECF subfamily)